MSNSIYEGDEDSDYQGWQNLPKAIIRQSVLHPFFGDIMKAAVMDAEFNHPKSQGMFAEAIGLTTAAVEASKDTEGTIFASGFLGDEDFAQLAELAEREGQVHVPGLLLGFDDEKTAFDQIVMAEANGK